MFHHGPETPRDSHAKSPRGAMGPCSGWERRVWIPRKSDVPRPGRCWRTRASSRASTQERPRNWGGLDQQGLFCLFFFLNNIIFWTDEEVSALNSSGKAFFLPPGPPCVWVAAGERSRTELMLLLASGGSASHHTGTGQHPDAGTPLPPKLQDPKKPASSRSVPMGNAPKGAAPLLQGHLPGGDRHLMWARWPRAEGLWQ